MNRQVGLALAFVAGVAGVQQLPQLPGWPAIALVGLLAAFSMYRRQALPAALWFGIAWALAFGAWRLQDRLDPRLEGRDLSVQGRIASLPERFERGWRFDFVPQSGQGLPSRLRLGWYDARAIPKAGEIRRLRVRLKRPHGTSNPGGFDYEGWLYAQGIGATGYVRASPDDGLLASGSLGDRQFWRQRFADRLDAVLAGRPFAGMVKALVLGNESAISQEQWQVLRVTGTAHLVAVSGSHIGLVVALVFLSTRQLAARAGLKRWSPPVLAAALAMLAGLAYTALADFAVPARRALIMAVVVLGAVMTRRHVQPGHALGLALFLVVLLDPLAVLAPGFWLSFAAVTLIVMAVAGRLHPVAGWRGFLRANWATALGLLPLLALFFQQAPLVSPLANLVAIPLLGTLAVPLALAGGLAHVVGVDSHGQLLQAVEQLLEWIWPFMEGIASWSWADWQPPAIPPWALALAGLATILLLMPRGLPGRWLALPLLLPALAWQPSRPGEGAFWLTLLDVGQGLSAVVRTAGHTLVFDAGPRLGAALDSGRTVVEPFLRYAGGRHIDTLLVSHGDNDHIGGADFLLRHWSVGRLYTSAPSMLAAFKPLECRAGQHWTWDGVEFDMLAPFDQVGSENDLSCVLKVSGPNGSALLTGDIERGAESRLVAAYGARLQSDVLVVPHHGSRTSSSEAFLAAVSPVQALVPAGYRNRFGFPHPKVRQRFDELGIPVHVTGTEGALTLRFDRSRTFQPESHRALAARHWQWQP